MGLTKEAGEGCSNGTAEHKEKPIPARMKPLDGYPEPTLFESVILITAGFMVNVIQGGLVYTPGLYINQWIDIFKMGNGVTSWLGALPIGLLCIFGPVSSILMSKYKHRTIMFIGGLITSIGLVIGAIAPNFAVLMLGYGVLCGSGLGIGYTPGMTFLTQRFGKFRAISNGIITSGASCGSFIFPLFISQTIDYYGWRGSLLLLSAANLHTLIFSLVFVRPSVKTQDTLLALEDINSKKADPTIDIITSTQNLTKETFQHWEVFKDSSFIMILIHQFLMYITVSVIFVHIVTGSIQMFGVDEHSARYLISIIGFANLFARLSLGVMLHHPKVDTFSVYIVLNSLLAVCVGLYPLCTGYTSMVITVAFIGMFLAPYGSLLHIILAELLDPRLLGPAYGYGMFAGGFGLLLGGPMAGWLYDMTKQYPPTMYFGSCSILISCVLLIPPWIKHIRKLARHEEPSSTVKEVEEWLRGSRLSI